MSDTMRSTFGIIVTAVACLVLLYFVYSLLWFVLVGRRKQQHRANVITGVGFAAVMAAIALWLVVASAVLEGASAIERLVLFTSVGLCIVAIVAAKFGSIRTALPIVACALIVALNAIGTVFAR